MGFFIFPPEMNLLRKFQSYWPYMAIAIVYATGSRLDIMEVDAAQYASISLEMLKSGNWLEVLDRNVDYLDKPPLLFWLSALSMKLFGIGSWQYKLPSILFSFLGIYSTFRLGKKLYGATVGHFAAMMLGSSLALTMINNDIKTDTILVASIVYSIWMLVEVIETGKWNYVLGASLGISAAMLTKGPIGLMMPLLAVGGHVFLKRDWSIVFNPKWLVVAAIVAVCLIPMCVGLYEQYGAKGLKFYFWTQSFGRITGENEWRNDTTPLYFFHVFGWSFLPWTLLGLAGIYKEIRGIRNSIEDADAELFLISGIVLVWTALSFSKFKLPHYIFVVYPLIAILAAKHVMQLKKHSTWAWTQLILTSLSVGLLAIVLVYAFPNGGWVLPLLLSLSVVVAILLFVNHYQSEQTILPAFVMSIAIGLGLNLHFYPQLLPYQANASVGKWVVENEIQDGRFFGFATGGRALDFYAQRIIPWLDDAASTINVIEPGVVIYANEACYKDLIARGYSPERELVLENFEVQRLSIKFLNPKTRNEATRKNYLMFY